MSAKRQPVLPSSQQLCGFLSESYHQLDYAGSVIEGLIMAFRDECLAERKQLRAEILEAAFASDGAGCQAGAPGTCPFFLTYRYYKGAMDIYWLKASFTGTSRKGIFRRVEQAGGNASLHVLLADAHPDEVETIRRHESRARQFRAQWKEYADLLRRLQSFMDAHSKD